jgi:hypothetical protein
VAELGEGLESGRMGTGERKLGQVIGDELGHGVASQAVP